MSKRIDLTGQKYNMLTVLEFAEKRGKESYWLCKCDCGNFKIVSSKSLKSSNTKSCGCLRSVNVKMKKNSNIVGNRYGRLVAIEDTGKRNGSGRIWICRCDCGNLYEVAQGHLKSGNVRSCGCLREEKAYDNLRFKDIAGKKIGKLLAIKRIDTKNGTALWLCQCDCGNFTEVRYAALASGNTVSCGCHKREQASKLFSEDEKIVNYRNETFVAGTKVDLINNDKLNKNNTTGYKGVSKNKKTGKYNAYIRFKGIKYTLGTYSDVISAAEARKAAENELYSDFLEWYAKEYPERWEKINKNK